MMEFGALNEIKSRLLSVNEDYLDLEWAFKNVTASNPIAESNSGLQFEKYGEGTLWGAFITGNLLAYDYGLKVVVDDCTIYDIVKHESEYYDAFNGIGFMTKSILNTFDTTWGYSSNGTNGSKDCTATNNLLTSSETFIGRCYTLPIPQAKSMGIKFVWTYSNVYDDGASLSNAYRCNVGQIIRKNVSQIVIPPWTISQSGNAAVRSGTTELLPIPIKFKDSVKVYGHFRPYNNNSNSIGFAMLTSK